MTELKQRELIGSAVDTAREQANDLAAHIVELLSDVPGVAQAAIDRTPTSGVDTSTWSPAGLARGPAGIGLLMAEAAAQGVTGTDPLNSAVSATVDATRHETYDGPWEGLGALAALLQSASHANAPTHPIMDALDRRAVRQTRDQLTIAQQCRREGQPLAPVVTDPISGLTGMAAHLRHRADSGAGQDVADALAATREVFSLARTALESDDEEPPGWGTPGRLSTSFGPRVYRRDAEHGAEHGAAHGVVALLSEAVRAGRSSAVESLGEFLVGQAMPGPNGPYWPVCESLGQLDGTTPSVTPESLSWCYGAITTGLVLHRAGMAQGRGDWCDLGRQALAASLSERHTWNSPDAGLCHGWSGLLLILDCWRTELAAAGQPLGAVNSALVEVWNHIYDSYDPRALFGWRFRMAGSDLELDLPGLLEGAAGTALTALRFGQGGRSTTGWERLFLLA